MIRPICSTLQLREWLHEFVLRPYLEGAERLTRAWRGVNFHSIYQNQIPWKQRIVSILTGLLLLLPFVNLVIWCFWETFGKPEILTTPCRLAREEKFPLFETARDLPPPNEEQKACPQNSAPAQPIHRDVQVPAPEASGVLSSENREIPPAPPSPSPASQEAEERIERLRFSDTNEKGAHFSDWKVELFPDRAIVIKVAKESRITAIYNPDWHLQEFDYATSNHEHMHIRLHDRKLHIVGKTPEGGERKVEHLLEKDYPWVQQPTFGLKKFILSQDKILHFYGVNPRDYSLIELTAKKIKLEELEGFGKLLKIEVRLAGLRAFLWKAEIWLHPETGIIHKMVASDGPFEPITVTERIF